MLVGKDLQKEATFGLALEGLVNIDQIWQKKNVFLTEYLAYIRVKWAGRAWHVGKALKHPGNGAWKGKESDKDRKCIWKVG